MQSATDIGWRAVKFALANGRLELLLRGAFSAGFFDTLVTVTGEVENRGGKPKGSQHSQRGRSGGAHSGCPAGNVAPGIDDVGVPAIKILT